MSKVLVIGGGAAGMIGAISAARNGNKVVLFEKNEKLGKKLYITGKGRCNITNAGDREVLLGSIVSNSKFLYSAFSSFSNLDTIDFFEGLGCKTKIERGNRVFPVSDKSSDVIGALAKELKRLGVEVVCNATVEEIVVCQKVLKGIRLKGEKEAIPGDRVIIATGGLSYPTTGSTGDGYGFAREMGHKITKLSPSLVPFVIKEGFAKELQGLSLKNVQVKVFAEKKEIFSDFGEMLFTHFGVSGPLILSASAYVLPYIGKKELKLSIDLKPALSKEQLDARLLRDFSQSQNKQYKNSLEHLLPRKLISVIISLSGIHPEKKVNLITREERARLADTIKNMELHISGLRDYKEAIVTRGGIDVKEMNPKTMESKLVPNVFFAGEVLDLDGLTGGFNLQIAWSTGYLAGQCASLNQLESKNGSER